MNRRIINQPLRRKCPQCDNAGFKRVNDSWASGQVFRCNYCAHEWIGHGHAGSDKREVISRDHEIEYWEWA